ncbi:MAG TPA: cell division ATP-binding protein FtsE [Haliangiales bacterium]|nr:cell division ATP-binding protein FtsE [Haliangiales bacterium]
MISLSRVTKRFGRNGETVALDDVSLHVEEGAFLLLTGASGAGKTTLLKLIFAAERPDTGKVLLFGRDISRLRRSSIPFLRRNVGVVFQDFKLLPDRTILDNVMISLEIRALPRRIMREKAADVLTAVGLGWRLDATPRQLSAGEQQRVAIARAIVGEPAILLADEPTGNLDPDLTREIMVLLSDVHRRGTTVVVATHDLQIMLAVERARFPRAHLTAGRVEILMPALPGPDDENIVRFPIMVGS